MISPEGCVQKRLCVSEGSSLCLHRAPRRQSYAQKEKLRLLLCICVDWQLFVFRNRVRLHPAHSEIHPIFPYNLRAAICRGINDRRSTRVPEHQNRSAYTCSHGFRQDCGDGIRLVWSGQPNFYVVSFHLSLLCRLHRIHRQAPGTSTVLKLKTRFRVQPCRWLRQPASETFTLNSITFEE